MILDSTDENYDKISRAEMALYEVIDPELMVNIVDLGLVYDVEITEGTKLKVTMTLTSPHCPMGDAIQTGVINVLEKELPEFIKIKVKKEYIIPYRQLVMDFLQ